ncbi:MAG TPA: T9SS type A sorting domain-containing protein [Alphaproteobacteria bacterium]|nr:T9SS type A sorting domain-containing protein [Alphaproteobacteria bacterium]
MSKLENIVKKFARNTILAGSLLFGGAFAQEAYSQNVVSGTVTSVPSNTPASQTRITFTNTANGNKYSQLTTDGTFSIDLPTGTYQRKIEGIGNYQLLDTLEITSSQTMNEKIIDDDPITSSVYGPSGQNRSLLYVLELLTNSDGVANNTLLYRVTNQNPWRIYARNYNVSDPESMPSDLRADFDYVLNEISSKVPEIVFNEQSTDDPNVGISFIYPTTANMPAPTRAWTVADENNAKIYVDREKYHNFNGEKEIILREIFARATLLSTLSTDPDYVTRNGGSTTETIHPDEVKVIRRVLNLPHLTDMIKHRDVVITSVPNTIFSTYTITAPANGSTISYDVNSQVSIVTSSNATKDDDGDALTKNIHVTGPDSFDKTINVANNASVKLNKSELKGHRTYTIDAYVTDGFLTRNATSITFTTPNTQPTNVSATYPTNASTVAYVNNKFEFTRNSNAANDVDDDALSIIAEVMDGTTIVKTITAANNSQIFINKSDLSPHKTYTLRWRLTDGIDTTSYNSITFKTPNILPAQTLAYPLDNSVVAYINNKFETDTNPDSATDADGDNLTKIVEIWNQTQTTKILEKTEANNTQLYINKTELQPHTTYIMKVKLTDGIDTTGYTTITFATPNTLPPAISITSPANNSKPSYDSNSRIEAISTPNNEQDDDGDNITKIAELWNESFTTLIKSYTAANNAQLFLPKVDLQAHTTYKLRMRTSDGIDYSPYSSVITFTTPNSIPTQAITYPSNNSTIAYDANNRFEVITTPNDAKDEDNDDLTKTIEVLEGASKIKDVTVANNIAVYVLKSELKPHTTYTLKAKLSDGIETTNYLSSTFTTPNFLPTQEIVSPANNSLVNLNNSSQIEIITSPNALKDSDNDDLYKTLRVHGPGLDTTITKPNNTQIYIPTKRLKPSSTYTIESTITDNFDTSIKKSSAFKTDTVVGVENPNPLGNEVEIFTFPNPVTEYINLQLKSSTPIKYHVEIYNNLGKLVDHDSQNYYGQDYEEKYDFSRFSQGMYIMNVTVEDNTGRSQTTTRKIIKN